MTTMATFAFVLVLIALLASSLIIMGRFPTFEGMNQQIAITYAYSKTCPHCKPTEAQSLISSFHDEASACNIDLNLDLLEVHENPDRAKELDVDATPTVFVKTNGSTTRLDDGSIGGLRAFLESQLSKCKSA